MRADSRARWVLGLALLSCIAVLRDPLEAAWTINVAGLHAVWSVATGTSLIPLPAETVASPPQSVRERMLYLAGVAEFRRGENSSAITELRSALAIQPSDQLAAFQAGLATQASGDYDSALPYWRAAEAANYFSRLGARSLAAGNLAGANLLYQTAAEIEPNRASLSDLGLVLSARGQWVSAAQAFARASEVDPTAPEPLIRQAAILQDELGQPDVAVPILERAVELAPNYSIWPYIRLGNYYRVLGDASSALAWYERAHSAFPNDPEPLAQISDLRSR